MLKTKKFQGLTFYYRGNSVDERVLAHSFEKDHFYPELIDFEKQDRMTIIDVGAHIGTFSVLSSLKFMQSNIIGIEPNPESISIFRKNVEQNGIGNIHLLEAALTDKPGPVKLYLSDENWLHSITNNFGGAFMEVQGVTLEETFKKFRISQCDLLKMNCEGAEFRIISGLSPEVLARIKMIVILFHEDLVNEQHNRKTLISHLKQNNFSVRGSRMRKNRGWIVAKNKLHYHNIKPVIKMHLWFSFFENSVHQWYSSFKNSMYKWLSGNSKL